MSLFAHSFGRAYSNQRDIAVLRREHAEQIAALRCDHAAQVAELRRDRAAHRLDHAEQVASFGRDNAAQVAERPRDHAAQVAVLRRNNVSPLPRQLRSDLLQGPFSVGSIVNINVQRWRRIQNWKNKLEVNLVTARGNVAFHWGARDTKVVCNSKKSGQWQHEKKYHGDCVPAQSHAFSMDIVFMESKWVVRFRGHESERRYSFPHPPFLAYDPVIVIELSSNVENPIWSLE